MKLKKKNFDKCEIGPNTPPPCGKLTHFIFFLKANLNYSYSIAYIQNKSYRCIVERSKMGGRKVRFLGEGGACNSVPNRPNDLKFCIQGAYVGYYWVLVNSRSWDLYRCQSQLEARTGLASMEVTWPWIDQNSIVTHKSPLYAKFQVIWSIGGWATGTPLVWETGLCSHPFEILSKYKGGL